MQSIRLSHVPHVIRCIFTSAPFPQQWALGISLKSNPEIFRSDLWIRRELLHLCVAGGGQVIVVLSAVLLCICPCHVLIHINVLSVEAGVHNTERQNQKHGHCSLHCHTLNVSSVGKWAEMRWGFQVCIYLLTTIWYHTSPMISKQTNKNQFWPIIGLALPSLLSFIALATTEAVGLYITAQKQNVIWLTNVWRKWKWSVDLSYCNLHTPTLFISILNHLKCTNISRKQSTCYERIAKNYFLFMILFTINENMFNYLSLKLAWIESCVILTFFHYCDVLNEACIHHGIKI